MPHPAKFQLIFAPETVGHLDAIGRKFHHLIPRTIDEQLTCTPERETRGRKPVEQPSPFGATWELRFGPDNHFRVFYEVDNDTDGPIVITRNGKAVAVLLAPVDDNDLESLILARSPRFQALLDQSRQSIQAGKGLSRKGFWHAVAEHQKTTSKARRSSLKKAG